MRKGMNLALAAALIMWLPQGAHAAHDDGAFAPSYYISAPVVDVQPITTWRSVRKPVRQCTSYRPAPHDAYERGHHRGGDENYFLPGLFGGIVGGLIGNQFGGGHGKQALTIAGAIAGSSIARSAARRQHRADYPEQICETRYETEVVETISAYDVTYEYAGREFSKRMSRHPGETVRVRVALEPALAGNG